MDAFMLYFLPPCTIYSGQRLGGDKTSDLKFLSLLKLTELPAVKDISLIFDMLKYIFLMLKISIVSSGTH